MKYGYTNADIKNIISYYKIDNDKLVVIYLDGHEKTYDKEKEQEIIDLMINQATLRQKSNTLSLFMQDKKDNIQMAISKGAIATIFLAISSVVKDERLALGFVVGGSFAAFTAILDGSQMIDLHHKVEELKKYKIFLSRLAELEEFKNNESIYNGIENTKPLTINTIDGFTLSDVKRISYNLDKLKKN